jgi:CheY-like chemotaxis protein
VAQRIVDEVARLLTAGRVALALYRPAEDFLTIVATHGYAMSEVEQLRIQPGTWVIGHVYSKGRPVLVRDVRKVHGMAHERRGYRSFSFAAVPIFAGSTTVGVLTATDKRDNSPFSRQDFLVLRTLSVVAGMALVASRSQTEAGRLAYAATVDALTGLLNRTSLDGRLHQEFERSKRAGNQLAVSWVTSTTSRTINDTHGHQVGDAVPRSSAPSFVPPSACSAVRPLRRRRVRNRCEHRPYERRGLYRTDSAALSGYAVIRRTDPAVATMSGVAVIRRAICPRAPPPRPLPGEAGKNWCASTPADTAGRRRRPDSQGARLMSSVDTNAWTRPDPSGGDPNRVELPYVLVADTNVERAAMCLDAIRPFKAGVLVARDGDEATRILERFGPPILLIIDLSLARRDGFAVIEGLRAQRRGAEIIAWAAFGELSEFAAQRPRASTCGAARQPPASRSDGDRARVRTPLDHRIGGLRRRGDTERRGVTRDDGGARGKARHLAHTPGVAVCCAHPAPHNSARRSWTSDSPIPHSPFTCRACSVGFSRPGKRWYCRISSCSRSTTCQHRRCRTSCGDWSLCRLRGRTRRSSGPSASSTSSLSR